jgi:actin-related protein
MYMTCIEFSIITRIMGEDQVVVVDIGSSSVKAGLSSDDIPEVVFPTVCGKPKFHRQVRTIFIYLKIISSISLIMFPV